MWDSACSDCHRPPADQTQEAGPPSVPVDTIIADAISKQNDIYRCFRTAAMQFLESVLKGHEAKGNAVNAWADDSGPRFWLLDTGAAQDMMSRHHVPQSMLKRISIRQFSTKMTFLVKNDAKFI